jgi:uncharacterized protein DUF2726
MEALLVLLLLAGFVAALGSIVLLSLRHPARPVFASQPAWTHPIPVRRPALLFSKAERSFYSALRALVPDHMIFVKVKLTDLVSVSPQRSFWEHFNPINRKHVDFVVCDLTLAPVVAIELDDLTTPLGRASKPNLIDSVLNTAALPVVHIAQKPKYVFNDLRRLLSPYLSVPRLIV